MSISPEAAEAGRKTIWELLLKWVDSLPLYPKGDGERMKHNCERHSEAQVQRGRTCVACEMEALQQRITRAQMLSTRMWNWMRNPDHAKDLTGDELQARFQREFRGAA